MDAVRVLLFAVILIFPSWTWAQVSNAAPAPAATEERHEDHEALRGLMKKAAEALGTRNFDAIAPLLHKSFTVVTVDNRKLAGLDEFRSYWNGLFSGPNAVLKSIEVHPEADGLTEFLDADTGVTHGTSNDVYHFADGDTRTMKTRWTAVVEKEADGWKLVKVHFSASLLDNPVVDAAKAYAYKAAAGGLVIGLAIGGVVVALLKRKRTG